MERETARAGGRRLASLRWRWRASWRARCRRWRLALPARQCHRLVLQPVAVFGTDDRGPLPAKYKDVQEKIGLLFNVRGRTVCTAFCVAQDVVATAGHCLHKIAGERRRGSAISGLLRNYDAVRDIAHIAGHANGTAALQRDVGLDEPQRAPADRGDAGLGAGAAGAAGLHQGRAADARAADRSDPEGGRGQARVPDLLSSRLHAVEARLRPALRRGQELRDRGMEHRSRRTSPIPRCCILHTCDTGGASSGSPMLLDTDARAGGDRHQRRHLRAVEGADAGGQGEEAAEGRHGGEHRGGERRVRRQARCLPAGGGAVEPGPGARAADAAQGSASCSPARSTAPTAPTCAAAIEAYEKAEGLPVTGLATLALLKRLGGGLVPVERAKAPRKARS